MRRGLVVNLNSHDESITSDNHMMHTIDQGAYTRWLYPTFESLLPSNTVHYFILPYHNHYYHHLLHHHLLHHHLHWYIFWFSMSLLIHLPLWAGSIDEWCFTLCSLPVALDYCLVKCRGALDERAMPHDWALAPAQVPTLAPAPAPSPAHITQTILLSTSASSQPKSPKHFFCCLVLRQCHPFTTDMIYNIMV